MALPLSTAIDDYFLTRRPRKDSEHTTKAYRADLAAVVEHLAVAVGVNVDELLVGHVNLRTLRVAFADYSDTRSKATIRRCWSTWNGLLDYLVSEGEIDGNPMAAVARPSAPSRNPKAFDQRAVERLLSALIDSARHGRDPWPELDLAVVFISLVTGVRSAEILSLDVGAVTGPEGERRVLVRGKGEVDRAIPIEPGLEDVLDAYLATRLERFPGHAKRGNVEAAVRVIDLLPGTAPLFVNRRGERMTRGGLQYLVQTVYRRAGIDGERQRGALVHALRHTFATRLAENPSTSVMQLMELMGHRSLATTQRYIESAGREQRSAVQANPAYASLAARRP